MRNTMQLQWTKTLSIISAILLVIFIISAGFYLLSSEGRLSFIKQKTLKTSSVTFPTVQPTTSVYPSAISQTCQIQIKYPRGWTVETNPPQNIGNPDYNIKNYNKECIVFKDAGNPNLKFMSGRPKEDINVVIHQSLKDTKLGTISMKNIDTYIQASEEAAGIKATNTEKVFLGGARGKYFELSNWPLPANYVFEKDDVIYTISWNKEYSGERRTDLFPFFSLIIPNSPF